MWREEDHPRDRFGRFTDKATWLTDWTEAVLAATPGLYLRTYREQSGYVVLDQIVVPERQQGLGTAIMESMAAQADAHGDVLALTPSTAFGASSVARLERFYKRFGFKPNRGRVRDFTTRRTMLRQPQPADWVARVDERIGRSHG